MPIHQLLQQCSWATMTLIDGEGWDGKRHDCKILFSRSWLLRSHLSLGHLRHSHFGWKSCKSLSQAAISLSRSWLAEGKKVSLMEQVSRAGVLCAKEVYKLQVGSLYLRTHCAPTISEYTGTAEQNVAR